MDQEKELTEKESLELIASMINKAKEYYHDTGTSAIMWGLVIAICSLVRFFEVTYHFRLPFDIYLLSIVAIIPQIIISVKEKKLRKMKSFDDTYLDYIWLGFGIGIFLMIFIVNSMFSAWEPLADEYEQLTGHPAAFKFKEYIAPLFLLLYGMPTFITGAACRFTPMLWGGIICWVSCLITIYTSLQVDLLLTAFAALVAWLIPGIMMEKEYRRANRELQNAHV